MGEVRKKKAGHERSAPAESVLNSSWSYNPFNLSSLSWFFLHSIHSVVTGRTFNLCSDISSWQISHIPKVPFSILSRASFIFPISFLSRSRIRKVKFLSDSRVALSAGSGRFSITPLIPLTVLLASLVELVSLVEWNDTFKILMKLEKKSSRRCKNKAIKLIETNWTHITNRTN